MGRLDGKVALVSGAARGMGEAIARRFVAEGARVVLGDILEDLAMQVADDLGPEALAGHLDVTSLGDWQRAVDAAVERFGKLDVLVNNAGIFHVVTIEEQSVEDYLEVIRVNQLGCWLGMKAAAPALRASGNGSIVNTSSVFGMFGSAGTSAYVASKFAVRGMTKCAALEFCPTIRVNSVHPGGVDTPIFGEISAEEKVARTADLPIPRFGRPEEVASLAVFLASDESAYCTGSEFVIDGGILAGRHAASRDPGAAPTTS